VASGRLVKKLDEFRRTRRVDGVPVLDAVLLMGPHLLGELPVVILVLVVDPVVFDEGEG
jgi:hypothetical protein